MKNCPRFEDLLAAVEQANASLEAHVRSCDPCRELQRKIATMLEALGEARLPEVPERSIARALAVPGRREGSLRSFLAKLLPAPDPGLQPAFRGDGTQDLTSYEAGPYGLEVEFLETGALVGTVASTAGEIETSAADRGFLYGASASYECDLRRGGRFRFAGVLAGSYALVLEVGDASIVLPELELGSGRA